MSLCPPFPILRSAPHLSSHGRDGTVYRITPHIAFKCPLTFEHASAALQQAQRESEANVRREKEVYRTIPAHPNLVACHLIVPEGIFMELASGGDDGDFPEVDFVSVSINGGANGLSGRQDGLFAMTS